MLSGADEGAGGRFVAVKEEARQHIARAEREPAVWLIPWWNGVLLLFGHMDQSGDNPSTLPLSYTPMICQTLPRMQHTRPSRATPGHYCRHGVVGPLPARRLTSKFRDVTLCRQGAA